VHFVGTETILYVSEILLKRTSRISIIKQTQALDILCQSKFTKPLYRPTVVVMPLPYIMVVVAVVGLVVVVIFNLPITVGNKHAQRKNPAATRREKKIQKYLGLRAYHLYRPT